MNGFELAERVAATIAAASLGQEPNAEARSVPIRDPAEFDEVGTFRTAVVWRGRKTEQETKSHRIRVFTIDVAIQRRTDDDAVRFKEVLDLADAIEDHLIETAISGVRRRTSFVGTESPYILPHLLEHGITTAVVTLEYELKVV